VVECSGQEVRVQVDDEMIAKTSGMNPMTADGRRMIDDG